MAMAMVDGLSDEERAALEDDDEMESGADGEDHDDDGVDAGDAQDAGSADAEISVDADDDGDEPGGAPQAETAIAPESRYVAHAPEGADEKLKALDEARAQLRQQFMEGELEAEEYVSREAALDKQRTGLERAMLKAEMAAEMEQQRAAQMWTFEVNRFMDDSKKAGLDYKSNELLTTALDAAVRKLGADSANSGKDARWFLAEADKQVRAAFGRTVAAVPNNSGKSGNRRPDLSGIPPTLANVPTAATNGTGDDEFTALDKLSGLELERAVARLSPDQQARYALGG